MAFLFVLVLVLIVYGSLYPFSFSTQPPSAEAIETFLRSWRHIGGRGDLLGNVALFVPYGFLGMLALPPRDSALMRFALLLVVGFAVAAGVQVVQLYLPSRDAALGDVAWNALGCLIGAALTLPAPVRDRLTTRAPAFEAFVPLALIACWFASELVPFVPTLDLQAYKDSLKPLLLSPAFDAGHFLRVYVSLLVVCTLAASITTPLPTWLLIAAGMAVFLLGKLVVVQNTVTLSDVAAAAAAFVTWVAFLRFFRARAAVCALLLVAVMGYLGLEPFDLRGSAATFHWLPFQGSLGGSMIVNASVIARKIFMIGALVYFLSDAGRRLAPAVLFGVVIMAVLEVAQVWVGQHTPEITDPLLVVLVGLGFKAMVGSGRTSPAPAPRPAAARRAPVRPLEAEPEGATPETQDGAAPVSNAAAMLRQAMAQKAPSEAVPLAAEAAPAPSSPGLEQGDPMPPDPVGPPVSPAAAPEHQQPDAIRPDPALPPVSSAAARLRQAKARRASGATVSAEAMAPPAPREAGSIPAPALQAPGQRSAKEEPRVAQPPPTMAQRSRGLLVLLFGVSFLILYGSLYPFKFELSQATRTALSGLWAMAPFDTSRGDILVNILLFVPFGFVGMLAIRPAAPRPLRIFVLLFAGFWLAFIAQLLQIFTPSRVPTLGDVFWNLWGIVIGCGLGSIPLVRRLLSLSGSGHIAAVPACLAGLWIAFFLAPFAPSMDFQLIKQNFDLMLRGPAPSPLWTLQSLVAWLLVFHFLIEAKIGRGRQHLFVPLVGLVLLARLFIVDHPLTLTAVLGPCLALLVWPLFRRLNRPPLLFGLLAVIVVAISFTPFELRSSPASFHWIPFAGVLGNNLFVNLLALLKKAFFYGSLIWLLVQMDLRLSRAALLVAGGLAVSEGLQIFVTSSTPEVTDAVLALMMAYTFHLLSPAAEARTGTKPRYADDRQQPSLEPTPTAGAGSRIYLAGFDGLRALAAMAVFMVHFNQKVQWTHQAGGFDLERFLANGNTGVALFFVLSGLLLSLPFWQAKRQQDSFPSLKGYAVRRLARILPAYYFCLFAILAAKAAFGGSTSINNVISHVVFLYNLKDFNILSLNAPFWTLAVEMQFYLILPLVFLALKRLSTGASFVVILLLGLGAYATHFGIYSYLLERDVWPINIRLIWPFALDITGPTSFVLKYSTIGHLPHFFIGVLSAQILLSLTERPAVRHGSASLACDVLFFLCGGAVLIILATALDDLLQLPFGRYNLPFVPLLIAVAVIALPISRAARKLFELAPIRWLGVLSYGIYIYHYPVQRVVARGMSALDLPVPNNALIFGIASLVLTLILAQASYSLLEAPVMQAARGWLRRRVSTAT